MTNPLSVRCAACLAEPDEPCIATSSDLPREVPHRLRGLAAATTLRRCSTCGGSGWEPTGKGPADPRLIVCPVCKAGSDVPCREGGEERDDLHEVRWRASNLGVARCGECDAVGWVPG